MKQAGVNHLTADYTPAGMPAPGSHIPALDGIRGLAVLLVMLCHFTTTGLPNTVTGNLVHHVFMAGWGGVDLFFVLSGFLITGILYDAKHQTRYFRNFYIRRFLRIFPLYYGFLIVFFWLLPHIHPFTPAMDKMAGRQAWLWGYGANLLMAREGRWAFEVGWMELGHFWTLAIEEQFYLLWPLVVLAIPRKQLVRVCIGCMVAALLLRTTLVMYHARPITVGMLTFCRFDALTVGGLGALLIRGQPRSLFRPTRLLTILLGMMIALMTIARGQWDAEDPLVQTLGFSLLDLFCAGILILALEPRRDNKLSQYFSSPALIWFGTYSYAMYVFHVALRPLFKRIVPVESLSVSLQSEYLAVAVYVLFSISVTALVAYLSWHLYEKHFLKLKDRFAPGRVRRIPTPAEVCVSAAAVPQQQSVGI